MAEDVDLLHKGGMSCYSSLPSLAPRWLQKAAYRAFPRFLLFAACAYVLQHPWNTDRDIGFSQRQTLIADIGPPSLTHMASTIFLHGAHDQQVGAGDRSFAVRVDTLMDSIQLIRTDLRPIDGILRIQVDRCPIPLLVPVPRQCGAYLLSRAVPPSQPLTPSVGSTPEVVAVTPGLIITTAPGTEKIQTRSRGAPSTRGHAGSVSLHAHIPGDIASFTTQHGAEGAVLTTTSQGEFRSLAYL